MASADHPSILIAEGVQLTQRVGHGAGGGQNVAPCVIGIGHHLCAAAVHKTGHVALRVLQVEILRAIVLHYKFTTFCPTLQPYIHFPATFSSLLKIVKPSAKSFL